MFPVFLQFCRVVCKLHEVKTLSSSLLYPYHLEQHITHRRPSINNGWIDEWTVALPWYAQYGFSLLHLPYLAPLTTGPEQSVLLILLGRNDCGLGTITCPELRLVKASRKKKNAFRSEAFANSSAREGRCSALEIWGSLVCVLPKTWLLQLSINSVCYPRIILINSLWSY